MQGSRRCCSGVQQSEEGRSGVQQRRAAKDEESGSHARSAVSRLRAGSGCRDGSSASCEFNGRRRLGPRKRLGMGVAWL